MTQIEFNAYDTGKNLPATQSSPEKTLTEGFFAAWSRELNQDSLYGFEFEMAALGRADILIIHNDQLTAVEVKVKDWRKGLQQAARYRYYAHRSILVMPHPMPAPAMAVLETFRKLDVGLWAFDPIKGRIHKHHTPARKKPLNQKKSEQAQAKIQKSLANFKARSG